jgi:uncharacterized hydrophobic protein (TIGR00271 family)
MNEKSPGTLVALLGPDLDASLQVQWALRLATSRRLDLLFLQRAPGTANRIVEVPLDEPVPANAPEALREVFQCITASPELTVGPRRTTDQSGEVDNGIAVIHARLKRVDFTSLASLRKLVLDELGERHVKLLTLARKNLADMSDMELVGERRLFLRYLPCETVLCHGLEAGNPLSRVLVATASDENGRMALRVGASLAAVPNGTCTALHVNPDVGFDSRRVGERRLQRVLTRSLGKDLPPVTRRVVIDNKIHEGIGRVWQEHHHDLLVVGAPRGQFKPGVVTKYGKDATVVITIAAKPIANPLKEIVEEGVRRIVPQIERDDRIALVDRVQSSAAWNFDFLALMVLSTTMAAVGLMQNSAAVVIGAMLVAPLMTPLLGLGLALIQGNPLLAGLSLRSVVYGVSVALFSAFLVGAITPGLAEPTREMLARGGPGLLDLVVAFAAGLAAAYASSRPGLIAALPGVAIAAALVPPIATSGLALSLGDFVLAFNAFLLFGINMVTIVLASIISLWLVGLRQLKKTSGWTVASGTIVIAAFLALGVYLGLPPEQLELTEEFPAGLMEEVEEHLGTDYRLHNVAVAYDELGVQLIVRVIGEAPAPEELATNVRTIAREFYDQPVRVRMLTEIQRSTDRAIPASDEH